MFRAVLLILYLGVTVISYGQSVPRLRKLADDHFEASQYIDAIKYYKKVLSLDKKDIASKFKLATAYHKTLDFEEAKSYYSEIIRSQNQEYSHLSSYHFGNILKLQGYFSTASEVFKALLTKPGVDSYILALARKQNEGCQLALDYKKKERGFIVTEMEDVNSNFHDFGATMNPADNSLVFVSTRNLHENQYKAIQYGGLLPDLVQYTKKNKHWNNTSSKQKFDRLNTEWAEGSGSFTADGKSFYFTSCQSSDGADCKIMVSRLIDKRWSAPEPLNDYVNLPGTQNKQPFITPAEDTLFFASNRPGGYGGSDIWMSLRGEEEGSWTPCINLGDIINTISNEITPYYSTAFSCLLFASDGHVGYGGYDIFAAKGESFFEPQIYNLGDPFNSPLDDTYFSITAGTGFISSNRKDQENLNLYTFEVPNEKLYLSLLISGESLIDERIIARYRNVETINLITFRIEDNQGFEVFEPVKKERKKPALLDEEAFRKVTGEGSTSTVLASASEPSQVETSQPKIRRSLADQSTIAYNRQETEYQAQDEYKDRKKGLRLNQEIQYQRTKRTFRKDDVLPEELTRLERFEYEKLYFGFASSIVNYNTQLALRSLVTQLKEKGDNLRYIHIISNTDDIGSSGYNLELSYDRGRSIKNYLVSKGIPEDKILITAKGEEAPVTKGKSWYHRQFNRRAEIHVYADEPISLQGSRLVVLRQDMTLEEAAERLDIPFPELKSLNRLYDDILTKGQVLRIGNGYTSFNLRYFLEETDVKFNFFPYLVKEGETLSSVARKFKTPEELLIEINDISGSVAAGQEIYVYNFNF